MKLRGVKPDQSGVASDTLTLEYNTHLTIEGIPRAVLDYKLGTRSALEWLVERYVVSVDAVKTLPDGTRRGSGIVNDPNRSAEMQAEPEHVARLVGRVVTVSLETLAVMHAIAAVPLVGV